MNNVNGEPIAVILPINVYEQIKHLLEWGSPVNLDADTTQELNVVWDDEGEIQPELKAQLLRQSAAIQAGERGMSLQEALTILEL